MYRNRKSWKKGVTHCTVWTVKSARIARRLRSLARIRLRMTRACLCTRRTLFRRKGRDPLLFRMIPLSKASMWRSTTRILKRMRKIKCPGLMERATISRTPSRHCRWQICHNQPWFPTSVQVRHRLLMKVWLPHVISTLTQKSMLARIQSLRGERAVKKNAGKI